jgi:hypothetical protein
MSGLTTTTPCTVHTIPVVAVSHRRGIGRSCPLEPTGEFGVFATGDGTTPQEPVERWGRAA